MNRFTGVFVLILTMTSAGYTQKLWTLEDCLEYAMENNIQLKRQELQSENARLNLNNSRLRILPGFTAFANHDFNSGKALNYDTYQWENREFEQGNLGLEGRLNVFSGFQNHHNVQQQRYMLLSRIEDVERTRNDISLNIAAAYFQILLDIELLEIARNQLEVSNLEVESAKSNFYVGNISRGRLLEIESQNAANEYQVVLARNYLSQSYLNMIQILQLDPGNDFRIERPENLMIRETGILHTVSHIYDEAEMNLPQVRGAEYFLTKPGKRAFIDKGPAKSPTRNQGPLLLTLFRTCRGSDEWCRLSIFHPDKG
jgi:outer membrane protein